MFQVLRSAREQFSLPHGRPVVVRDGVAGDLKQPGFKLLLIVKGMEARVDFDKDLLKQVFSSVIIGNAL